MSCGCITPQCDTTANPPSTISGQEIDSSVISNSEISGSSVTGLPNPSAATDAATKAYVDVLRVENIAALKALDITSLAGAVGKRLVLVSGYYVAGDGGGGLFFYDSASAATADDGTIVNPNSGSGQWKRAYTGPVNVRWFGAKGTGSDNDTTRIQKAFDVLDGTDGGGVFFPAGTYLTNAAIVVDAASVWIEGEGRENTILLGSLAAQNGFSISGVTNVAVRNITVQNTALSPTGAGIRISGTAARHLIEHVQTTGFGRGVYATTVSPLEISDLFSYGNAVAGLEVASAGAATTDITLTNSLITDNAGDGIRITGQVSGVYVTNVQTSANDGSGLVVAANGDGSPSQLFFTQLISDSNEVHGVSITAGNTIDFVQCWHSNRGSGSNFVFGSAVREVRIFGGKVFSCTGHGLEWNGVYLTVNGTVFEDIGTAATNTSDAIYCGATSARILIDDIRVITSNVAARYGVHFFAGCSHYELGSHEIQAGTAAYLNAANSVDAWGVEGTFVPTDGSGAGLAFTGTPVGRFIRQRGYCEVWFDVTYPVTASGAGADITGLPVAAKNLTAGFPGSVFSDSVKARQMIVAPNTTQIIFFENGTFVQTLNSDVSAKRIVGHARYLTAS